MAVSTATSIRSSSNTSLKPAARQNINLSQTSSKKSSLKQSSITSGQSSVKSPHSVTFQTDNPVEQFPDPREPFPEVPRSYGKIPRGYGIKDEERASQLTWGQRLQQEQERRCESTSSTCSCNICLKHCRNFALLDCPTEADLIAAKECASQHNCTFGGVQKIETKTVDTRENITSIKKPPHSGVYSSVQYRVQQLENPSSMEGSVTFQPIKTDVKDRMNNLNLRKVPPGEDLDFGDDTSEQSKFPVKSRVPDPVGRHLEDQSSNSENESASETSETPELEDKSEQVMTPVTPAAKWVYPQEKMGMTLPVYPRKTNTSLMDIVEQSPQVAAGWCKEDTPIPTSPTPVTEQSVAQVVEQNKQRSMLWSARANAGSEPDDLTTQDGSAEFWLKSGRYQKPTNQEKHPRAFSSPASSQATKIEEQKQQTTCELPRPLPQLHEQKPVEQQTTSPQKPSDRVTLDQITSITNQMRDTLGRMDETQQKDTQPKFTQQRTRTTNEGPEWTNGTRKAYHPNVSGYMREVLLQPSSHKLTLSREHVKESFQCVPITTLEWHLEHKTITKTTSEKVPVAAEKSVTIKTTKCVPKTRQIPVEEFIWERREVPCKRMKNVKVLVPCTKTITIPSHRVETKCVEVEDTKTEWVKRKVVKYQEIEDFEEVVCKEVIKVPTWKLDERDVDTTCTEDFWTSKEVPTTKMVKIGQPCTKHFEAQVPVKKLVTKDIDVSGALEHAQPYVYDHRMYCLTGKGNTCEDPVCCREQRREEQREDVAACVKVEETADVSRSSSCKKKPVAAGRCERMLTEPEIDNIKRSHIGGVKIGRGGQQKLEQRPGDTVDL